MRLGEAVDCVKNKIENTCGLVAPLIESTLHARRLILVFVYRAHEAIYYLQGLDGRVHTFWKRAKRAETGKRCEMWRHVHSGTHRGKILSKDISIRYLHSVQPQELHNCAYWLLETSRCAKCHGCGESERNKGNLDVYRSHTALLLISLLVSDL